MSESPPTAQPTYSPPRALERLTGADKRLLLACALISAVSLFVGIKYYFLAFPEASIEFRVTRESSVPVAASFLSRLHLDPKLYRHAAVFGFDDEQKTFLERELGVAESNRLLETTVRLWRWRHRWFRPLQKEELAVEVTTKGEVVGFEHLLAEDAPGPDLPVDDARRLAETFLASTMGRPLASLAFVEASTQKRPHRTDHSFTWKVIGSEVRGADYRVAVDVAGGAVAGYREWLKVPDVWVRGYQQLRSKNEVANLVDNLLLLLTVIAMLAFLASRVRRGDVRWRAAAILGGITCVLLTVSQFNSLPSDLYDYDTTASFGGFLVGRVLVAVAGGLAVGVLILLLAAAAEPIYRERFPERLSMSSLLRRRAWGTREAFVATLVGLTLTCFFFAYENVFYLVAHRLGAWSPRDVAYSDLLSTAFPWVYVLFFGFLPAISEELISRVFSVPFFERLFRSTAFAIVRRGVHLGLRPRRLRQSAVVDPRPRGGARRHRLRPRLPALRHRLGGDLPLLGRRALHGVRAHPLAEPLLPGVGEPLGRDLPACSSSWPRSPIAGEAGSCRPEVDQRGRGRRATAGPGRAVAATAEPATLATGRSRGRASAGAAARRRRRGDRPSPSNLAPIDRFGDWVALRATRESARESAAAFLREAGFDVAAYRRAVRMMDRTDPTAAAYLLEKGGLRAANEVYATGAPTPLWRVRFFVPGQKEEHFVSVDANTGKVVGFRRTLLDDAPGARLDEQQALALARAFLRARGFDPDEAELKEQSEKDEKARRDHTLVWELAVPGAGEAKLRHEVVVQGGVVGSWTREVKVPEAWRRAREKETALTVIVRWLKLPLAGMLGALALLMLVAKVRAGEMPWKVAVLLGSIAAAAVLLRLVLSLDLLWSAYDTAMPAATFAVVIGVSLAVAALGILVGAALVAGLAAALYPDALAAWRSGGRRVYARDALVGGVVALGLALGLPALRELVEGLVPQGRLATGVSWPAGVEAAVPWLADVTRVVSSTLFVAAMAAIVGRGGGPALPHRRPARAARAALRAVVPARGGAHARRVRRRRAVARRARRRRVCCSSAASCAATRSPGWRRRGWASAAPPRSGSSPSPAAPTGSTARWRSRSWCCRWRGWRSRRGAIKRRHRP